MQKKYSKHAPKDTVYSLLNSLLVSSQYEDIEEIFQAVRDIQSFQTTHGGKFIFDQEQHGRYHTPQWDIPLLRVGKEISKIAQMLEGDIYQHYSWIYEQSMDNNLLSVYDNMIKTLRKYSDSLSIFTTNYDRSIEHYCNLKNFLCIDGFKWNSIKKKNIWVNDFPYQEYNNRDDVLFLHKLHGSLGWKLHKQDGVENTQMEVKSTDPNYTEDLLVYPTLTAKDVMQRKPYTELVKRFEEFMADSFLCVVVGFSFRDFHLNTIFQKFLEEGRNLVIISPSAIDSLYYNLLKNHPLQAQITEENKDGSPRELKNILPLHNRMESDSVKKIMDDIESFIVKL